MMKRSVILVGMLFVAIMLQSIAVQAQEYAPAADVYPAGGGNYVRAEGVVSLWGSPEEPIHPSRTTLHLGYPIAWSSVPVQLTSAYTVPLGPEVQIIPLFMK